MDTVYIHYIDMPDNIHGTHCVNDDGSYSVFLNNKDTEEKQRNTYDHEMRHINKKDLLMVMDVDCCEYRTHLK